MAVLHLSRRAHREKCMGTSGSASAWRGRPSMRGLDAGGWQGERHRFSKVSWICVLRSRSQ